MGSQFGIDFSAATAGKTWSEIQTITANTKAGQGTLGAAYSALSPTERTIFDTSSAQSSAGNAGTVSVVTNAPAVAPAKKETATTATTGSVSTAEANAIKAALKTQATSKKLAKCSSASVTTQANDAWYMDPDKSGNNCADITCATIGLTAATTTQSGDGLTCTSKRKACGEWKTGSLASAPPHEQQFLPQLRSQVYRNANIIGDPSAEALAC